MESPDVSGPTTSCWRSSRACSPAADYVSHRTKVTPGRLLAAGHSPVRDIVRLLPEVHSRHTTAMHLLQSGVDISVIALWLGHESPSTTHQYVEADLAMKDRALARLQEPDETVLRYRAPDSLLEFLKTL